ncbi:6612_t:CDS:2, partial [Acaulospora morrowiae]
DGSPNVPGAISTSVRLHFQEPTPLSRAFSRSSLTSRVNGSLSSRFNNTLRNQVQTGDHCYNSGDRGRTTHDNGDVMRSTGEISPARTQSWKELYERDPRYDKLLPSPEEIIQQEQKLQQELYQYQNGRAWVQYALQNSNEVITEQKEIDQLLPRRLSQSSPSNGQVLNDDSKKHEEKKENSKEQYQLNIFFTICRHINAEYTIKSWPKNKRYCAILRVPILKRSFGGFKSTKELALEMVAGMAIEEFSRRMPEIAHNVLKTEDLVTLECLIENSAKVNGEKVLKKRQKMKCENDKKVKVNDNHEILPAECEKKENHIQKCSFVENEKETSIDMEGLFTSGKEDHMNDLLIDQEKDERMKNKVDENVYAKEENIVVNGMTIEDVKIKLNKVDENESSEDEGDEEDINSQFGDNYSTKSDESS